MIQQQSSLSSWLRDALYLLPEEPSQASSSRQNRYHILTVLDDMVALCPPSSDEYMLVDVGQSRYM